MQINARYLLYAVCKSKKIFRPKNWFTLENAEIIFEEIFRDIYSQCLSSPFLRRSTWIYLAKYSPKFRAKLD